MQRREIHTEADDRVTRLFLATLDAAGGPRKLVEEHNVSWLPEIMESSYIVVMQEDENKTPEEIASKLGVSKSQVESVLSAPTEYAVQRLADPPPPDASERNHVAGGAVKFAYGILRREGHEGSYP